MNIKNVSDASDGTDTYEILVGHTNRPESQKALDYLNTKASGRYNDYIICTIGKKIVLNAESMAGIKAACEYFAAIYLKTDGIQGGIAFIYEAQGNFENITVSGENIGRYTIVRPLYNSSYLTQLEIEKLIDTVYEKTGYMLNVAYDNTAAADLEIIVGNCERDGVQHISNYGDWSVSVSGKKVYLNGGSAHATAMAVTEFCKKIDGNITESVNTSGNYDSTIASYDKSTTYKYVWGDDFDGDKIDSTKWWHIGENGWKSEGLNGKTSVRSSNPNDWQFTNKLAIDWLHIYQPNDGKH